MSHVFKETPLRIFNEVLEVSVSLIKVQSRCGESLNFFSDLCGAVSARHATADPEELWVLDADGFQHLSPC